MEELIRRPDGALTGATIAILMESDYVEPELHYYQRRFAEEGAKTVFLTRLWGQDVQTFHGHEFQLPTTVDGDLEAVDTEALRGFDALIVPSGMVSDRLRYTEDVTKLPPASLLLREAFGMPEVLKGIICHGMWLVAPIPEVIEGRRITCHNNLLGDVKNMGAVYTDQDVVVDGDLVTGRQADRCHLFARMIIDMVQTRRSGGSAGDLAEAAQRAAGGQRLPAMAGVGATDLAGGNGNGSGSNGASNGSGSEAAPGSVLTEAPPAEAPDSTDVPDGAGTPDGPDGSDGRGDTGTTGQDGGPPAESLQATDGDQPSTQPGVWPQPESEPPASEPAYRPEFTFSDLVAGYVTGFDGENGIVTLETSDGRAVSARLTETTYSEFLRNLGEPYLDATPHQTELLTEGRYVYVYGIWYPQGDGYVVEAKRIVFVGRKAGDFAFEQRDWWVHQLRALAGFYRRAQFGENAPIDYRNYRTMLRLGGDRTDSFVQETDTISRMIYGMASAYMLTGEEDFLEVAEKGTEYLREHMRFVDRDEDIVYWYHGIDVRGETEHKLFTSEFGDDYDAIPMYEQIYALAGQTQVFRLTGDPAIASDIEATYRLFQRFFKDEERGGYYSHVDPIQLRADTESLGPNKSRKNWNSIGDHAPAYLINLWLATGEDKYADMLEETFDLIEAHLPDPDSPFVQERFHGDWSADREWNWQQDRAVVGHNLKIAWNMTRLMAIRPKDSYKALADRIARTMPELGSDTERGGWYDVVERRRSPGDQRHRFVWHDRKAWWQQEQSILAYQILSGETGNEEFRKQFREAAAFYNAFFLDHDEGGVYFNVLANGIPYLQGDERLKGSHSMSMYHTAELCFLGTVYGHLLHGGEPLTLWFKPRPDGFADRVLRVAPDALPRGTVRLDWVEIDGRPYDKFDADELTVQLPESESAVTVRAHLSPTGAPLADTGSNGSES